VQASQGRIQLEQNRDINVLPSEASVMGRYIPQYIFDGLVVSRLTSDLAGVHEQFDRKVAAFLQKYPDESGEQLLADLAVAASEARRVVARLVALPDHPYCDEAAVVEGLMDVLSKSAEVSKPLWRRMVENYFTNVQPNPIADRVARAREHLIAAGNVLADRAATLT
jgi:hypothetical protein